MQLFKIRGQTLEATKRSWPLGKVVPPFRPTFKRGTGSTRPQ